MSATPDTHPTADTATRPIASHPANPVARKTTISGLSIHTQMSSVAGAPIVYLLGDVADNSPVQVPEGVSLVNIGVDLWEENFSPWCAPRVFAKGPNFGDGAQKTLDTLINQVIPWAESDLTEPPAYRVLVGYSLAGLFSLWAGVSQQVARDCQPDDAAAQRSRRAVRRRLRRYLPAHRSCLGIVLVPRAFGLRRSAAQRRGGRPHTRLSFSG